MFKNGNPTTPRRVWIDLDNSPHVLFFAPLIRRLQGAGTQVLVTARAFSQTEELARSHGIEYTLVGEHQTPRTLVARAAATFVRAYQLQRQVAGFRPHVAASHGSRALVMAAAWRNIPSITFYDYEFASIGLYNRLSRVVSTPTAIPLSRLQARGLAPQKHLPYPGFKEEVYLAGFQPQTTLLSDLNLDPERLIITVRPPAEWAHYHSHHSQVLFQSLIERLRREPSAQCLILTRTHAQADAITARYGLQDRPFRVLKHAVDGLSLMWHSDAVFSGGGTMVREAAVMGLPVYSTFAGQLGAVDEALESSGRLTILRQPEQISRLAFSKRTAISRVSPSEKTADFISAALLAFAEGRALQSTMKMEE